MRMGHVASARVRSRPYQGAEAPHQRMGLLPGERRRVRCGADRRRYGLRGAHLGIGDGLRAGHVAYGQRDLAVSDGALQAARHLGRGRDLLREQPRIVPLRGCRRAAPPQRVVRGLRRWRRSDVRGRAGRGAARFDGDQHAMGRRPARVLLQPEDRRHAGEGQFQEGAFGARVLPRELVRPAGLGARRMDARQHVVLGRGAGLAGRSSLRPQPGLRVRRHVGGFREHGVHRRCCAQVAPRGLRHPREDGRCAREEDGRSLPAHAALAYDRRRGTTRPRVHAAARPCGLDGLQADPIRPAPGIRPLRRCGDA